MHNLKTIYMIPSESSEEITNQGGDYLTIVGFFYIMVSGKWDTKYRFQWTPNFCICKKKIILWDKASVKRRGPQESTNGFMKKHYLSKVRGNIRQMTRNKRSIISCHFRISQVRKIPRYTITMPCEVQICTSKGCSTKIQTDNIIET